MHRFGGYDFNPEYELEDLLDRLVPDRCSGCHKPMSFTGQLIDGEYAQICDNDKCYESASYDPDLYELVDNVTPIDRGDHYQLVMRAAS